ncbi:unnamed protein product [Brassicogethes aeneus]|uniref:C2H2-type domain-containing protein n=1 Tax=Brassicogethes aeneus TaxID=1431903 RepID=A0A9P0FB09_BRAAE|nr:unnamed protein product [Brassicogethes aeneus]
MGKQKNPDGFTLTPLLAYDVMQSKVNHKRNSPNKAENKYYKKHRNHPIGKNKNIPDIIEIDDSSGKTSKDCNLKLKDLNIILKPLVLKRVKNIFACNVCNKIFYLKDKLESHKVEDHFSPRRKNILCYICSAKFTSEEDLLAHKVIHSKETDDKNETSEESISTSSTSESDNTDDKNPFLKTKRRKRKRSSIPTTASVNDKSRTVVNANGLTTYFYTDKEVLDHLKVLKTDNCVIKCLECNLSYDKSSFLQHINMHNKGKVYNCPKCNDSFEDPYELRRHGIQIHKDKITASKSTLEKQNELVDVNNESKSESQENLTCELCYDEFKSNNELLKHMEFHRELDGNITENEKLDGSTNQGDIGNKEISVTNKTDDPKQIGKKIGKCIERYYVYDQRTLSPLTTGDKVKPSKKDLTSKIKNVYDQRTLSPLTTGDKVKPSKEDLTSKIKNILNTTTKQTMLIEPVPLKRNTNKKTIRTYVKSDNLSNLKPSNKILSTYGVKKVKKHLDSNTLPSTSNQHPTVSPSINLLPILETEPTSKILNILNKQDDDRSIVKKQQPTLETQPSTSGIQNTNVGSKTTLNQEESDISSLRSIRTVPSVSGQPTLSFGIQDTNLSPKTKICSTPSTLHQQDRSVITYFIKPTTTSVPLSQPILISQPSTPVTSSQFQNTPQIYDIPSSSSSTTETSSIIQKVPNDSEKLTCEAATSVFTSMDAYPIQSIEKHNNKDDTQAVSSIDNICGANENDNEVPEVSVSEKNQNQFTVPVISEVTSMAIDSIDLLDDDDDNNAMSTKQSSENDSDNGLVIDDNNYINKMSITDIKSLANDNPTSKGKSANTDIEELIQGQSVENTSAVDGADKNKKIESQTATFPMKCDCGIVITQYKDWTKHYMFNKSCSIENCDYKACKETFLKLHYLKHDRHYCDYCGSLHDNRNVYLTHVAENHVCKECQGRIKGDKELHLLTCSKYLIEQQNKMQVNKLQNNELEPLTTRETDKTKNVIEKQLEPSFNKEVNTPTKESSKNESSNLQDKEENVNEENVNEESGNEENAKEKGKKWKFPMKCVCGFYIAKYRNWRRHYKQCTVDGCNALLCKPVLQKIHYLNEHNIYYCFVCDLKSYNRSAHLQHNITEHICNKCKRYVGKKMEDHLPVCKAKPDINLNTKPTSGSETEN